MEEIKKSKNKDFVLYRDVKIPMRDKINLTADIYFPSKEGIVDFSKKYHVILIRSPYKKIPSLGLFPFDFNRNGLRFHK